MLKGRKTDPGRGAVWLARLNGVQEVGGSNPLGPTRLRTITTLPQGSKRAVKGNPAEISPSAGFHRALTDRRGSGGSTMSAMPKIWFRKSKKAFYLQIDRNTQMRLGKTKAEAEAAYRAWLIEQGEQLPPSE